MMATYVVFFIVATALAIMQRAGIDWWKTGN